MIDINFDFTSDSKGYWEGFWDRNDGLGYGGSDPDTASTTLRTYHQLLWSRMLPNGERMQLKAGSGPYYLTWKDFRFGSDAIIVGFRYQKYRYMIEQVMQAVGDYKKYYEGEWNVDVNKTLYGSLLYSNGDYYEGEFKLESMEGYGKMKYIEGLTYEGRFKNDKQDGYGLCTFNDNLIVLAKFKEGKIQFGD